MPTDPSVPPLAQVTITATVVEVCAPDSPPCTLTLCRVQTSHPGQLLSSPCGLGRHIHHLLISHMGSQNPPPAI